MQRLQEYINKEQITVIDIELPNVRLKGLWHDDTILMNTSIKSSTEYACVMAEELGHYYTSSGNSLDYTTIETQRQEDRALRWALNAILPLEAFIEAYLHGCRNKYEIADFLDITEIFLEKAISHYTSKHDGYVCVDGYAICFNPLGIMRKY